MHRLIFPFVLVLALEEQTCSSTTIGLLSVDETRKNDVAEIVQGSSNESRLVISEATGTSAVDEEFTSDFEASSEFTADGLQRYMLGKRLGDDKGKSNS
ncbi:hypothetical protein RMATCC62417_12861 [Rhizopus microsporus]|nr:hypothetical protein RMATCC62417_12861 [Rhizopus microsporus]